MKTKIGSLIAGVVLLAAGACPTFAHHSFAAEFDSNKPFTVTGVVSKVAWQNPHVYVYVDAKDDTGKMVTYALECNSVNTLLHKGWTRDALKRATGLRLAPIPPKISGRYWMAPYTRTRGPSRWPMATPCLRERRPTTRLQNSSAQECSRSEVNRLMKGRNQAGRR